MEKGCFYRKYFIREGISFGSALAMVVSYTVNKSLIWAIIHGFLSWIYVIYYALTHNL
ncbi:MAG: hypothetical protein JW769_02200 [Parachlamydiales bacterium]|nr:hypothetical protein [Parachlamydiales bacterium]